MTATDRARRAGGHDDPLVMLVASSGGHLSHLLELQGFWRDHRRVWVSFDMPDAISRLDGEEVVWAYRPTTRNVPNLVRNLRLAAWCGASPTRCWCSGRSRPRCIPEPR